MFTIRSITFRGRGNITQTLSTRVPLTICDLFFGQPLMSSIFSFAEKGNTSQKNKAPSQTLRFMMVRILEVNQAPRPGMGFVQPAQACEILRGIQQALGLNHQATVLQGQLGQGRHHLKQRQLHWGQSWSEGASWKCCRLGHRLGCDCALGFSIDKLNLPTNDGKVQSGSVQLRLCSRGPRRQMITFHPTFSQRN